jgi:hypothetical protein
MKYDTLYRTDHPEGVPFAEYYQPQILMEPCNGRWVFFLREKHGRYSDQEKRAIHALSTLEPEEGFDSFEAALAAYENQVDHRASEGFVHSFSIEPPVGQVYRRIDVK